MQRQIDIAARDSERAYERVAVIGELRLGKFTPFDAVGSDTYQLPQSPPASSPEKMHRRLSSNLLSNWSCAAIDGSAAPPRPERWATPIMARVCPAGVGERSDG